MITLKETGEVIQRNRAGWRVPLMDFVDDFRTHRDPRALTDPFPLTDPPLDALLASTAEALCRETGIEPPSWITAVPAAPEAWFVSGFKNLRAIALAESPLPFRLRKIFVLENFLARA